MTGIKRVRRVALVDKEEQPVRSVPAAVEAMARLKVHRSDNTLGILARTPKFSAYTTKYLDFIRAGEGMKKPRSIKREESSLEQWSKLIGELPLDKIRRIHINQFIEDRRNAGKHHRTINQDVITLRCVLRHAVDEGWLKAAALPTAGLKPLRVVAERRPDFSPADLEKLCQAAADAQNGTQFVEYIRTLAYCGGREQETLALKWSDVDFKRNLLTIGSNPDTTKSSKTREVNMNRKLRQHLLEMKRRHRNTSDYLFPSPLRGEKDEPIKKFRASLHVVRKAAGMDHVGFHTLRHFFCSYCVMSGVPFATIASWVGHADGGFLVSRLYSHLAADHKRQQAQLVNFGEPTVMRRPMFVRKAGV